MRRWLSIAGATALEILSEPLSLLILLSAFTVSTLAPAFHYHQFGEATRMARDAGMSSVFIGGVLAGVFGTLRTFRRELESGTAQMALAHPISRTGFFLSKVAGAALAMAAFMAMVAANSYCIVRGAEIGSIYATCCGDISRIWGPSLALGVAAIVMPLAIGAGLNRFFRMRFVLSAILLAAVVAAIGLAYKCNLQLLARMLPVTVLIAVPVLVLVVATAALAVRFPANVAASAVAIVFLAMLPFIGNYYLSDALAKGGSLSWGYVAMAVAVAMPSVVAFLLVGIHFINRQDVS